MPQFLIFLITTGAINYIYGYFAIGVFILLFYQGLKNKKILLNGARCIDCWLLFGFGVTYSAIAYGGSIQSILYYTLVPVVSYLAGWSIIEVNAKHEEGIIYKVIIAALLGCCVHAGLNYITNAGRARHLLTDFFTGELRAATGSGSINTIAFSLFFFFLQIEKRKIFKMLGLACFGISILYAVLLGTRTQFVILAIVSLFVLVLYVYEHRGSKENWAMIARLIVGIALVCGLFAFNVMGLQDTFEESNLNARFTSDATAETDEYRFDSITDGIISLFEYPMGGRHSKGYFHNMWLDVGRIGGIIPTIFITFFTISNIIGVYHLFRSNAGEKTRYMMVSITFGFMLNFLVEPVMEGLFDSFYLFCIMHGMLKCLMDTKRNRIIHKRVV